MDALLRECNVGQTVLVQWFSDRDPVVWETSVVAYSLKTKGLVLKYTVDDEIYVYLPHELTKERIKIFENEQLVEDENIRLLKG